METLVHLPSGILPAYSAVPCEMDESNVEAVDPVDLPSGWKDYPPPRDSQAIGDRWVAAARSAALRVPSMIVPMEFNYVLNPAHPDFARIRLGTPLPFPEGARLVLRPIRE